MGQLGNGTETEKSERATKVADLTDVMAIAAGGAHACALTSKGAVLCWGRSEAALPNEHAARPGPVPIVKDGVFAVSAGGRHDCILTAAGGAQCMGWGSDGQLGTGDANAAPKPADVTGLGSGVFAVSAGDAHSCAVRTNGTVACWGSGKQGRLGNGDSQTYTFSLNPVDVVGLAGTVASVGAGGDRTCALMRSGSVKCWGRVRPGRPLTEAQPNEIAATAMDVPGLAGVSGLAVGKSHSCALLANGTVKCWGWNEKGQLGNGATSDSEGPVDVVGLPPGVLAISAGESHTCAAMDNGGAYCWGANAFGQLGDGTTKDSARPVAVAELP
jgi:alpha-tubulin suppressor-like RCC1 family protein